MADPSRVDFGKTAEDYGRHRQGFPDRFFEELIRRGVAPLGARALDLGTGTGTVARGLARRHVHVCGLDPAAPLLEQARALDAEVGVRVDYRVGAAEALPLEAATFDLVTAGQCWHWFDGPQVYAEVRRVLRPGGTLVIAHFDWLPLPGTVPALSEALILKHNSGWRFAGGDGFHTRWARDAWVAGGRDLETFSFDVEATYSHADWRGRIRASAGVGASLSPTAISAFDAEHELALRTHFPDEPLRIPHRAFALIVRMHGP